jgi:hypothetical protein
VTERVTQKVVSFLHPFVLAGVEGEQPAGSLTVETIEEPVGNHSLVGYRRVSTTITVTSHQFGAASRQVITIDPRDLDEALKRDAEKTVGMNERVSS